MCCFSPTLHPLLELASGSRGSFQRLAYLLGSLFLLLVAGNALVRRNGPWSLLEFLGWAFTGHMSTYTLGEHLECWEVGLDPGAIVAG